MKVVLFLFFFLLLFQASTAFAGEPQACITQISHDLAQIKDPKMKSSLFIYRARQYAKIKQWDMALEDYNDALELNHKGWIHLERSQFLLQMGKYELAYEDANAAKDEVPTLAKEADVVIEAAVAEVRRQFETDHPPTIIMNTRVDPYRKTRFDVMREQGAFTKKSYQSSIPKSRRTASITKSKSSCAPRARS